MPRSTLNESERTSSSSDNDLPLDIATDKSEIPAQPKICFPSRLFGASGRSFQAHWYKEFPWIEFSVEKDVIFCFPCRFFNLPCAKSMTFIHSGFRDWKHRILTYHDSKCSIHKDAVVPWKQFKLSQAKDASIGVQLNRQGKKILMIIASM